MKIHTILDLIDLGSIALPEFQRGYVWNREQVRRLMQSLYRRHPVGSLLVWETKSEGAVTRGDGQAATGTVKLLLDGQQRITTLYGIIRGRAPRFFDGNSQAFAGLHFNLEEETFEFYAPAKMKGDPMWVNVTEVMQEGAGKAIQRLMSVPSLANLGGDLSGYVNRLTALDGVKVVDLHIDEVAGEDKTVDVVVEIFNSVNSGGTKLSKGDLALAKICAGWPEARDEMKRCLTRWQAAGFHFSLEWLLRNVTTILTGDAMFAGLANVPTPAFAAGLQEAASVCDHLLNMVSGRLGLDHDRVLGGRYAFPVMGRYLSQNGGKVRNAQERDKLLYWYVHSLLWGRFTGSTETIMNQDLHALDGGAGSLENLIRNLEQSRGDLRIRPADLGGSSFGSRFYPLVYLLTRVYGARDWGNGLPISANTLGKLSSLQVHHIFPKSLLYEHGYARGQVNAVANFCFLTQESNLDIGSRAPEIYFPEIEQSYPGALASQWIPMDPVLWKVENYRQFLEARRELLARAANEFLGSLLAGSVPEGEVVTPVLDRSERRVPGAVEDDAEEELIQSADEWVTQHGLPAGEQSYELVNEHTGEPIAVLDLAWPQGLQPGLSQPVALLINEEMATLDAANRAGFLCFTTADDLKQHVLEEVLGLPEGER